MAAILTIERHSRTRAGLLVAGTAVLGLSAGLLVGRRHAQALLDALRELWVETLLPAFYLVHTSGLPFCS